jgi:hypothetical protein
MTNYAICISTNTEKYKVIDYLHETDEDLDDGDDDIFSRSIRLICL